MRFCKKYNKFMSGGSDYHAKNKPDINLGTGRNNNMKIEKSLIEPWINKVRYIQKKQPIKVAFWLLLPGSNGRPIG